MKLLLTVWLAINVALKLAHVIVWSWWLVLIPLWIYVGFIGLVLLITFIVEALRDV